MSESESLTTLEFGHFTCYKVIGQSTYFLVYEAKNIITGEIVALKALNKDVSIEIKKQFAKEIEILRRLDVPNVVKILYSDFNFAKPYYCMNLVEGVTLHKFLEDNKKINIDITKKILATLTEALDGIHKQRVIHGDLKPSNIMIDPDKNYTATILDFGISKFTYEKENKTSGFFITPAYVAPEVISYNNQSIKSDLYSFAVIAYELLCGERPYKGDVYENYVNQVLYSKPISISEVNEKFSCLDSFFERAFSKNEPLRPESAREIFISIFSLLFDGKVKEDRRSKLESKYWMFSEFIFPALFILLALIFFAITIIFGNPQPETDAKVEDISYLEESGGLLLSTIDESELTNIALETADSNKFNKIIKELSKRESLKLKKLAKKALFNDSYIVRKEFLVSISFLDNKDEIYLKGLQDYDPRVRLVAIKSLRPFIQNKHLSFIQHIYGPENDRLVKKELKAVMIEHGTLKEEN